MTAHADVLHVAPVLAEDVRQQARALAEAGRLRRLVTSWAPRDAVPHWLRHVPGLRGAGRRRPAPVPARRVTRLASADVVERMLRGAGAPPDMAVDRRLARVDRSAARWAEPPTGIVLGREDGCLHAFRRARREGLVLVYDLPTAAHETARSLLAQEATRFAHVGLGPAPHRALDETRCARKRAERSLADHVLCPSRFVRESLAAAGIDPARVHVLPFAADPAWLRVPLPDKEPVFLQVGQLSMRKGVHRLLAAWKRLGAYRTHRLRLIGPMHLAAGFLRDYAGLYEHLPALPRAMLPAHYARARALVVNSVAEGYAMVIPEAMSCGTPVIASRTSGAEGVVRDGEHGRLVEYGDDEALLEALDSSLSHPGRLAEMGAQARHAAAGWTWTHYRAALIEWLDRLGGAG